MLNQKRDLIQILVFQILTVPTVILLFKFVEPRQIAAVIASTVFISFGIFGLVKLFRWPDYRKEILFWLFCVHLFILALPILFARLLNWTADFSTLTILGIPAPIFHKISERFALVMLIVILQKMYELRKKSTAV